MSDLTLDLDDTDFAQLAQLGQSLIPTLAPAWTDHNIHDPGIMLMELIAYIADAQIYSLARSRRDERLAYGRLLGLTPRGPIPATGLLWPQSESASFAPGTVVDERSTVSSTDPRAPQFCVSHSVSLTGALLRGVTSRRADGTERDFTRVNAQDGATFQPFAVPPHQSDELRLLLEGELLQAGASSAVIAIGVDLQSEESAPAAAREACAVRLTVSLLDSGGERPLELVHDGTHGLLRSGVILVRVGDQTRPYDPQYSLTIRAAKRALLRSPQLARVGLNVLPMIQLLTVVEDAALATGLPDQTYTLGSGALVFGGDEPAVTVEVEGVAWQLTRDLSETGPDDERFELDEATATLRFGNGVNGKVPPLGKALRVSYRVSAGARGLVPARLSWRVRGIPGVYGVNRAATVDGEDGRGLAQLRALARQEVHTHHPLVTAADLTSAALAFRDLGVARAMELKPDNARCAVRGTRTLLVVSREQQSEQPAESADWLAEIARRLSPHLPLGQRLQVVAPHYLPVRVHARVMAAGNLDLAIVAARIQQTLSSRLAVVAAPGESEWAFGRMLTTTTVQGWLRATEGVARVLELTLGSGNGVASDRSIDFGSIGLPRLVISPTDLVVERFAQGVRQT